MLTKEVVVMAENMKALDIAAWVLTTVGALNWGLVGAVNINVVDMLLGAGSMLARIVYVLVGLGGLLSLIHMIKWSRK